MKTIVTKVDGIGLTASHYAAMTESEAVAKMEKDNITNDAAWAKKAYAACVKAVADDAALEKKLSEKAASEKAKKESAQAAPQFLKPAVKPGDKV